jgi:hypothetical protein
VWSGATSVAKDPAVALRLAAEGGGPPGVVFRVRAFPAAAVTGHLQSSIGHLQSLVLGAGLRGRRGGELLRLPQGQGPLYTCFTPASLSYANVDAEQRLTVPTPYRLVVPLDNNLTCPKRVTPPHTHTHTTPAHTHAQVLLSPNFKAVVSRPPFADPAHPCTRTLHPPHSGPAQCPTPTRPTRASSSWTSSSPAPGATSSEWAI